MLELCFNLFSVSQTFYSMPQNILNEEVLWRESPIVRPGDRKNTILRYHEYISSLEPTKCITANCIYKTPRSKNQNKPRSSKQVWLLPKRPNIDIEPLSSTLQGSLPSLLHVTKSRFCDAFYNFAHFTKPSTSNSRHQFKRAELSVKHIMILKIHYYYTTICQKFGRDVRSCSIITPLLFNCPRCQSLRLKSLRKQL